ncbi:MAG TPA: DNA polymerase III subunit alpha [Patescibacteria group bacterium]|jgi:DNA polymerase-3 subunit alpha|nr:DNA polymerase III subunit alpha [Patescibacteria group bacterium]
MFTHLHCHSHYSLLDGLSKIPALVDAVKADGQTSIAITDHGVMYGVIDFYNACREAEIKPIIGMEAYIAPRSMADKEGKSDADYFHMTLLAENYEGYLNLIQLTTIAHVEGFYYKPRIDLATLKKHSAGIIALSGCPRGHVPRALAVSEEAGEEQLKVMLDIFGPNNFFLELQRNANPGHEELQPNDKLIALGKKMNVGVVATQDCHYIRKDDAEAQDIMVCIGTGKTVEETKRLDMRGHDLSLRPIAEMEKMFADVPEAISNTQVIANRCNVEIQLGQNLFPKVKLPPGKTSEEHLTDVVNELSGPLYADDSGKVPPEIQERIDYELDIINSKGFAPYFLMVANVVKGAHELGAITNTRGSAAGSIVGKILAITNIDPLYYELPFERFLTKHRPTPPDIDLDIADDRRDEVIAWMTNEYGHDNVAQIITFGTMKARAVIRDVGRALAIPYGKCDRIAKMIPLGKQGFEMTLEKALGLSIELKTAYDTDPETQRLIDICRKLEGCVRHASIHAAGIVITPTPLTDNIPVQKEPDGDRYITQYDMYALDLNAANNAVGAIKLDLLGIRNLSILEKAVRLVKIRHGLDVDIGNLPHPDPKTFAMLSKGLTFGVFQLGSSGMTRYLKELRPNTIFDISAMVALYRPGPMQFIPDYIARKHNPKLISYLDPELERILSRTYGILVYQDDLLIIAHDLAGYTWEEVDKFRKAVGKKIPAEMAKQKEKFVKGCISTSGWSEQKANQIWTWIEPFAAYGFNKSHSASYALVGYQTAYMKANYAVEFMAAVMTAESGDEEKIYAAVEECKKMGIAVLPPDVTESYGDFTVIDEKTIRFGLRAIKNLGSDVVRKIIDSHKAGVVFDSLEHFLTESYTKSFNKRSWEALAKSGALDRYGDRAQLLASTEHVLDFLRDQFKQDNIGQNSLFGESMQVGKLKLKTDAVPATTEEKLGWEKEHLGLFVSAHPLDGYRDVLKGFTPIGEVPAIHDGQAVIIGGIICKYKRTLTKKNDPMAFFTLQDLTGTTEVLVFPKVMLQALPFLDLDRIVQVKGRVSDKDGERKIIAEEIKDIVSDELYTMALSEMEKNKQIVIHMQNIQNAAALNEIKELLVANPGNAQVYLSVGGNGAGKTIKTQSQIRITQDLLQKLRKVPDVVTITDSIGDS